MVIYKALTWIGGISLIGVPILASQVAHYPLIFAIELGSLIGLVLVGLSTAVSVFFVVPEIIKRSNESMPSREPEAEEKA